MFGKPPIKSNKSDMTCKNCVFSYQIDPLGPYTCYKTEELVGDDYHCDEWRRCIDEFIEETKNE